MKADIQQDGFTLIEVLIAMAVLTLGILSVFLMQIGAVRGNSLATHLTEVSTRAQDRVEQILSWDAAAITANLAADSNTLYPGAGEDGTDITADFRIQPGTNRAVDGTVVPDTANPFTIYWNGTPELDPVTAAQVGYRVQVTVVWNEAGRQRQTIMYVIKPI